MHEEDDATTANEREEDEEVVDEDEVPTLQKLEACWLIQITVADIQRKHNSFFEEIATLELKSQ